MRLNTLLPELAGNQTGTDKDAAQQTFSCLLSYGEHLMGSLQICQYTKVSTKPSSVMTADTNTKEGLEEKDSCVDLNANGVGMIPAA